jgi:hypothetical protein
MAVRRIEDQKTEEKVEKLDPLKEPDMVTAQDILGVAIPKKSDEMFARYGAYIAKDEETGLKFNIAVTKTRR